MVLDGVNFVFHNVPGAEAPTALTFTIPDKKAYAAPRSGVAGGHTIVRRFYKPEQNMINSMENDDAGGR